MSRRRPAGVDPAGADESEQALGHNPDRAGERSGRGVDFVIRPKRLVEVDRQGCGEPERANPADPVTGQLEGLFGRKHARAGTESRLALAVVDTCIAARDQEDGAFARPERERLGDPSRLDAERGGGFGDCRRAPTLLDDGEIGRVLGKPRFSSLNRHARFADSFEAPIGCLRFFFFVSSSSEIYTGA